MINITNIRNFMTQNTKKKTQTNNSQSPNKLKNFLIIMTIAILTFIIIYPIVSPMVLEFMKPQWQFNEDTEISSLKTDSEKENYISTKYALLLRNGPNTIYQVPSSNESFTYQELYDYVSDQLHYQCTQLHEYADDIPRNQLLKCTKSN